MTDIASSPVTIQSSVQSVPSVPAWFGEVTLIVQHLKRQGVLAAIEEQVRFAHRRFGHYEVLDFVVVLFGYAIPGCGGYPSDDQQKESDWPYPRWGRLRTVFYQSASAGVHSIRCGGAVSAPWCL